MLLALQVHLFKVTPVVLEGPAGSLRHVSVSGRSIGPEDRLDV